MAISIVISIRPVRAEQFRVGMTTILGRPVMKIPGPFGEYSFQPWGPKNALNDGDWVVEIGPALVNNQGTVREEGTDVRVLSNEAFHAETRPATGDDMSRYVEAQRAMQAERRTKRLQAEAIARAKALEGQHEQSEIALDRLEAAEE